MNNSEDILAIDDDEDTIEGLLSEFDLLGRTIRIARTLEEAASRLRDTKYKILFVDLRMKTSEGGSVKEDGGLELIRNLRNGAMGALNQDVPYVLISAQAFWVERLEVKLNPDDLERTRFGRLAKFSKGDSLTPLVQKVVVALGWNEGA